MKESQQTELITLINAAQGLSRISGGTGLKDDVLARIKALIRGESPALDAELADVQLFLWCRANGFNILDVAMAQVTPDGAKTPHEEALIAFDAFIELRRVERQANRQASNAQVQQSDASREALRQTHRLEDASERMIGAVDALLACHPHHQVATLPASNA